VRSQPRRTPAGRRRQLGARMRPGRRSLPVETNPSLAIIEKDIIFSRSLDCPLYLPLVRRRDRISS